MQHLTVDSENLVTDFEKVADEVFFRGEISKDDWQSHRTLVELFLTKLDLCKRSSDVINPSQLTTAYNAAVDESELKARRPSFISSTTCVRRNLFDGLLPAIVSVGYGEFIAEASRLYKEGL